MIFPRKEVVLKDGTKVVFKSPEVSDAKMLVNSIIKIAGSTDNLLSAPEDFDKYLKDITLEEKYIQSHYEGKDTIISVYHNDLIVGSCNIDFHFHQKDRHRASVGIAIEKEYQDKGIGSLLFDELINIAKQIEGVEQLELSVISTNERAKHLYTKKGFVKVGDIPRELKLKDGRYLNGESMVLFLK